MNKKHNIPSLKDFLEEGFYNPFSDEETFSSKPKRIDDVGGTFQPRKETFSNSKIEFSKRKSGEYTVIAKTKFRPNDIIEICPLLFVSEESRIDKKIKDTVFEIDKEKGLWAIALGYGSIYRHSPEPNVDFAYNAKTRQMYFIAKRLIKIDEELTIHYGKDYFAERMNFNNTAQPVKPNNISNENSDQVIPDIQQINKNKSMAVGQANQYNPGQSGHPIMGAGQQ